MDGGAAGRNILFEGFPFAVPAGVYLFQRFIQHRSHFTPNRFVVYALILKTYNIRKFGDQPGAQIIVDHGVQRFNFIQNIDIRFSQIAVKHNPLILGVDLVIFDKNLNASARDLFTDGLSDVFLNRI